LIKSVQHYNDDCRRNNLIPSRKIILMKTTVQVLKNIIQRMLTELLFNRYLSGIRPEGITIDCGANVGAISAKLAKTGAKVYAFEPNPYAFQKLTERVKSFPNVVCTNKGVWDRNTTTSLYFHQEARNDDAFWSFGSSIMKNKGNIDQSRSVEVELIDLTSFIEGLAGNIDLLKIDIEGAECELLEKFISKELQKKVKMTLVETHDSKIEGQKQKTDRVRRLIKEKGITNIKLSWL
jgi:FkbM family methyltransferase